VATGGIVDTRLAYTLAALTGLVRREGITAEEAAARVGLSPKHRAQLLPLVSKFV
jgi:hypothetical protein